MISNEQFVHEITELSPALYRVSISILRKDADAQDAVQQALLNAWAAKEKVKQMESFRAWITRIVINECRNIQRYRMRIMPVDIMLEDGAVYQAEDSLLQEAISGLSETLRTPLLLHYMEGYSEKETAAALHISVTAVKNRLFRARRLLEGTLTDREATVE